jgi:acyl-CoA reductase-like NAD-dependent aldehyde dehydrogenase
MATTVTPTAQKVVEARSYVAGEWIDGSGETVEVRHPGDGSLVSRVTYLDDAQVQHAINAAYQARGEWAKEHVATRVAILKKAADLFEGRAEEAARLCTAEMGKTINEAREDAYATAEYIRILCEDALRQSGKTVHNAWNPEQRKRVLSVHVPHGVVAILTPWNFPLAIPIENIAPALATGNTVVWKPSEVTPGCSQILAEALVEAGLPTGVFNLVQGSGTAGAAIVEHPNVAMVSFTGSTATGRRIAQAAGVKKLLLELGGNGPMILMADANIDEAVKASVNACFYVGGQCCTAAERILVHSSIHDEYVEKLTAAVRELTVGDPFDEETDMGPLAIQSSIDKTVAHIRDARNKGAQVVQGGGRDGMYHEPTVLVDVTPDMEIAREETFGPIAPIIRFDTPEEALEIANGCAYGLNMAVWTASLKTAWDMAEGLEAGTVHINESTNHWELFAPFGGVKQSGVGRIDGEDALREYTTPKQITFDLDKA